MAVQTDERMDRPESCTRHIVWCGEYICEIILKSHDKLQSYGQDTNMLTNGQKFANEWPYGQTNGQQT